MSTEQQPTQHAWNLAGLLAEEIPNGTKADYIEALGSHDVATAAEALTILVDRFNL